MCLQPALGAAVRHSLSAGRARRKLPLEEAAPSFFLFLSLSALYIPSPSIFLSCCWSLGLASSALTEGTGPADGTQGSSGGQFLLKQDAQKVTVKTVPHPSPNTKHAEAWEYLLQAIKHRPTHQQDQIFGIQSGDSHNWFSSAHFSSLTTKFPGWSYPCSQSELPQITIPWA